MNIVKSTIRFSSFIFAILLARDVSANELSLDETLSYLFTLYNNNSPNALCEGCGQETLVQSRDISFTPPFYLVFNTVTHIHFNKEGFLPDGNTYYTETIIDLRYDAQASLHSLWNVYFIFYDCVEAKNCVHRKITTQNPKGDTVRSIDEYRSDLSFMDNIVVPQNNEVGKHLMRAIAHLSELMPSPPKDPFD
jgi:hypothetical protein